MIFSKVSPYADPVSVSLRFKSKRSKTVIFRRNTDFSSKIRIFRRKYGFFVTKTDFFVIPLSNRARALRTPPNARLLFFVSRDGSSVGADLESKMSDLKFRPEIAFFVENPYFPQKSRFFKKGTPVSYGALVKAKKSDFSRRIFW